MRPAVNIYSELQSIINYKRIKAKSICNTNEKNHFFDLFCFLFPPFFLGGGVIGGRGSEEASVDLGVAVDGD